MTKLAGAAVALLLLGAAQTTATSEPLTIAGKTIFTKGEGGYNCFRIPALVRTQDRSALLAFAEGRHNNCDDTGDIDVVLKRSTDDGKTWRALELVTDGAGDTRGNPVPIVDRATGRISLLTTHNPGPQCNGNGCTRTPFLQHSTNPQGTQWTKPVAQPQLTKPEWNTWYATGPGHGLQMTRGEHVNRMVAGINFEGQGGVKGAGIVYSDDGGTNWRLGALDDRTGKAIKPQELSLLETVDAEIYAAARNQDNSGTTIAEGNRAHAVSADGGETFRAPFQVVPQLKGPVVQGSVVRLRATTAGDPRNLILFSGPYNTNPDMDHRRHTMRIRTSSDEGATWQEVGTVVDATWSAYSDLINLGGGWAGLLYEAGSQSSGDANQTIRYARFSENDLAR
ncbi:sialidase family protein [Saccharopolyspora shandongensis]|uniref:sialidase family protein n=1 Tax=Saccharopolyspora shandongensis TaxID=418495 RepID=UPI00343DB7F3